MTVRRPIATVVILACLLFVLLWLQARRTGGAGDAAAPPSSTGLLPAGQPAPSRANVSPEFGTEIAAVRGRLEADPGDTAALLRLARLLQDAHQPAAAVGYYRKYLALAPANRQAWLDLAAVAAATGDWAGALAATDSLLARDPLDPAALFNRGAIHANLGEPVAARRWWRQAASQTRDPGLAAQAAEALRRLDHTK